MILRSQYILPSLSLYLTTLPWAISSKRWKYLIGFPPLFLLYTLKTLLLAPKQLNPFPIAFTLLKATQSRLRNLLYRLLGVNITGYAWLQKISIPRNWADITIEKNAALDLGVVLLASGPPKKNKIHIHSGVYINRYTILDAHQSIVIERNVMIGPHTYITDADHGLQKKQLIKVQPMTIRPVRIEQDAWIGAHVTILKGVTIGRGAIIGSGAVVTKNIEPYTINVGIPARKIGERIE
jgi:acetyltransferase-like isoleucine patch superfamily enzyme